MDIRLLLLFYKKLSLVIIQCQSFLVTHLNITVRKFVLKIKMFLFRHHILIKYMKILLKLFLLKFRKENTSFVLDFKTIILFFYEETMHKHSFCSTWDKKLCIYSTISGIPEAKILGRKRRFSAFGFQFLAFGFGRRI